MTNDRLKTYRQQLYNLLNEKMIAFWLDRSIDKEYGGYITSFDENGEVYGELEKNIVTQSRMLWGFSYLLDFAKEEDKQRMLEAANYGAKFLIEKFWDKENGGFYWLLNKDGSVRDDSKLTYGESFAIYALAQYHITTGDEEALVYACKCFDLLQEKVVDKQRGGYFENVERDFSLSPDGEYAGDRKSLDIHMHLMEAFTTLYIATKDKKHHDKLVEVYNLIKKHMINVEKGYGYNQFDLSFNKLPAINIKRTWNAERESSEIIEVPTDTTSYGHNVELSWLADLALQTIGHREKQDDEILKKLLDHALLYGYDYEYGGVYRDGVADEKALIKDKEWWQNFESMVGFLNGYLLFGEEKYLDAFIGTWQFVDKYFINKKFGESKQLLSQNGDDIVALLGNAWKGIYHTGRAIAECIYRIDKILLEQEKTEK